VTALLEAEDLVKHFPTQRSLLGRPTAFVRAVEGVSFSVNAGETLALVGESGCGKSTVSRLVLRLIEPDAGRIRFEGRDLLALDASELRAFRRKAQLGWDRDRARPAVGEGFPLLLFRLQAGSQSHHCVRFSTPP